MQPEEIVARYVQQKSARAIYDRRWELMARYVAPDRTGIIRKYAPGQQQNWEVYDATMMSAADIAARFLAGEITNPANKWFGLKELREELNDRDEVQVWLESCRDKMLTAFDNSNFYGEVFEFYKDFEGFGNGAMFAAEKAASSMSRQKLGFRGFRFETTRIGRYVIARNGENEVDTFMREYKLSSYGAAALFGKENLSRSIQETLTSKAYDKQFDFLHVIQPRSLGMQTSKGSKGMPWGSFYIELESKHLIDESGYHEFPVMHAAFSLTPGEVYGRGPGELCFPDVKTLNTAKKLALEDFALKVRPPTLVAHDSVIGGTLRLIPGAPTAVRTQGGKISDLVQPYQTGSNPEVSQVKEEELRRSIRQIYMIEQIMAMLEVQKPEMTAYEFGKKMELLFKLLGPSYGNLHIGLLRPLIDRCFSVMYRAGAFDNPPAIIQQYGFDGSVIFQNPITRAQRMDDVTAIENYITQLGSIAQFKPEVLDKVDFDVAADVIAEDTGVPAKIMRPDDQVQQMRKERSDQQQQDQQVEQAGKVAEGLGKVAPFVQATTAAQAGAR